MELPGQLPRLNWAAEQLRRICAKNRMIKAQQEGPKRATKYKSYNSFIDKEKYINRIGMNMLPKTT